MFCTVRMFRIPKKEGTEVERFQFPLRPSSAKTVHKAQGDTLEEVAIDLTGYRVFPHIHYVSLSRAKALQGLKIVQLNKTKISVSPDVQEEMKRLRQVPFTDQKHKFDQRNFKVIYENVRSLRRYIKDLKVHPRLVEADILFLSETRLVPSINSETLTMPGFKLFRNDNPGNNLYGSAAYVSETLSSKLYKVEKLQV